jgi:hypothetical protein
MEFTTDRAWDWAEPGSETTGGGGTETAGMFTRPACTKKFPVEAKEMTSTVAPL